MKLNQVFYSLQGEGSDSGLPTFFVRMQGCNLKCDWCDTKKAQDPKKGYDRRIYSITKYIRDKYPLTKRVCITGGEPFMQLGPLGDLVRALENNGYEVSIETNGSIHLNQFANDWNVPASMLVNFIMDVKCPSSGMSDKNAVTNMALLDEYDEVKFVIDKEDDLWFAFKYLADNPTDAQVLFSPTWNNDPKVYKKKLRWLAQEILKSKLDIRLQTQIHKMASLK